MIKTVKILKKNIKNKKKSVKKNIVDKKKLKFLKTIKTFNTLKVYVLDIPHKKAAFVNQLQVRHLYNLTLQRRFYRLVKSKKKKKYKVIPVFVRKKIKSFKKLLEIYSKNFARFVRKRKKFKKSFKRLLRKHKRKKKWRRRGVFKLFRSRYCFKHKFYIPRHFEINYKTGNIYYLGYNDPETYNFRLPFLVNARKLSTWLSS